MKEGNTPEALKPNEKRKLSSVVAAQRRKRVPGHTARHQEETIPTQSKQSSLQSPTDVFQGQNSKHFSARRAGREQPSSATYTANRMWQEQTQTQALLPPAPLQHCTFLPALRNLHCVVAERFYC